MKMQKETNLHIDDISLPEFLAGLEDNCLYHIDLFPVPPPAYKRAPHPPH